jgi:hypothetical protein
MVGQRQGTRAVLTPQAIEVGRLLVGVVIDDTDLFSDKLQEWEDFYNLNRPHGGLNGQTPYERLRDHGGPTPPESYWIS